MADKANKYEVGFQMTFGKIQEDGTVTPGMVASITYTDMDYENAVLAESCMKPTIEALFALGEAKNLKKK